MTAFGLAGIDCGEMIALSKPQKEKEEKFWVDLSDLYNSSSYLFVSISWRISSKQALYQAFSFAWYVNEMN